MQTKYEYTIHLTRRLGVGVETLSFCSIGAPISDMEVMMHSHTVLDANQCRSADVHRITVRKITTEELGEVKLPNQ